jgi:hypothetical protein
MVKRSTGYLMLNYVFLVRRQITVKLLHIIWWLL